MLKALIRLYWRIYFLLNGAPTKQQVDAKLARITGALQERMAPKSTPTANCDCAVYSRAGDFIHCYPNIPRAHCDALGEGDLETDPLDLGGCASVPSH